MNYIIIGKKKVDYFSKKKQKQVTGVELYLRSLDPMEKDGVGYSVLPPIYFSSDRFSFDDFNIDDIIDDILYNRFGNITGLSVV